MLKIRPIWSPWPWPGASPLEPMDCYSVDFFSGEGSSDGNRRNSVDFSLKTALSKLHLGKTFGQIKRKKTSHYYPGKYTASNPWPI